MACEPAFCVFDGFLGGVVVCFVGLRLAIGESAKVVGRLLAKACICV